jgi:ataxia telangiectasia mutated family protein
VVALGSDGRAYKQLVKTDDLKGDRTMQQVFGVVNALLASDPRTRARALRIRTYRVVPLSPNSGVIEWVENTSTLARWLWHGPRGAGDANAHARLRPGDWTYSQCFQRFEAGAERAAAAQRAGNGGLSRAGSGRENVDSATDGQGKSRAVRERMRAFADVCAHFQPVFRHYFLERFPLPCEWYARRLAYTRSLAASSMAGHVLGIGDRHTQNILIDNATAEVLHIDFGIVFEQGLELPTPEVVPFRLTRDLVDGMGATGVEGAFRRCCEETLSVLRAQQSREIILTILEVFVHDPLYRWSRTQPEALRKQRGGVVCGGGKGGNGTGPAAGRGGGSRGGGPVDDASTQATVAADASGVPADASSVLADAERASGRTSPPPRGAGDGPVKAAPESAAGASRGSAGGESAAATLSRRVLSRVRRKLNGQEDADGGSALGVEGQVARLINEARNPEHLAVMYKGWAPWV